MPLQFKENFFLLPLHQDYLFQLILYSHKWCENILYSHKCLMACPVTPSQVSHHDDQRIFALAYILASQSSRHRKVWASFWIRAFIPPGFAFTCLSQKPSHPKFPLPATGSWALSETVLFSFCFPRIYFWASLARASIGIAEQGQLRLSLLFNPFFTTAALAQNAMDIKVLRGT